VVAVSFYTILTPTFPYIYVIDKLSLFRVEVGGCARASAKLVRKSSKYPIFIAVLSVYSEAFPDFLHGTVGGFSLLRHTHFYPVYVVFSFLLTTL
jgi:hypothetical protein